MSGDTENETIQRIKAVGDWELDVLAIPYGGPNAGKDSDGEYFSPETELYLDQFPTPLVVYYHGLDDNKKPMGAPEVIGKAQGHEKRPDGVWVRVVLDKANEYAKRVWESAKEGLARASSGSVAHLVRTALDGLITHWAFAELSLFETDTGKQPANNYAVALPAVKAMYEQAGISWPDTPEAEEPEAEAEEPTGYSAKAALEVDGETSLDRLQNNVHSAFESQFPHRTPEIEFSSDYWIMEVFDTYVIVSAVGKYYQVEFSVTNDEIVFVSSSEWVEVEEKREWAAKRAKHIQLKARIFLLEV